MLNWVELSSTFGRRTVLLIALGLFAIGAIICGLSHGFISLIVGRSIQGVGGGGLIALTQVLITDMAPLRMRGKFFALISTVWALGSVTGPIAGGALAGDAAWRWMFWLQLPFVGLGLVGAVAFLKLHYRERSRITKLQELDYIGSTIFVGSVTSFLIGVSWGGVQHAWSDWHVLVPLILGVTGLLIFCLYELKAPTGAILPLELFSNASTSIVYISTMLHGIILWTMVYYLPVYFQGVKGYSPLISGVAALPQTCTVVPCAMAVGICAGVTKRYRWALWLGWLLTTLGCGLLILLDVSTGIAAWIFLELVSGVGIGLLFPSMSLAIQASSAQQHTAVAATLFAFFRAFGQAVGVAVGGVLFQNRFETELESFTDLSRVSQQSSLDAVSLVQVIREMPPDALQTVHLKIVFSRSCHAIWAVMCGLAGISLIANLFVREYDLDQAHETDQGFVYELERKDEKTGKQYTEEPKILQVNST